MNDRNEDLRTISYYGTGGCYGELLKPRSRDQLVEMVKDLWVRKKPYFLLGQGSNSLVIDEPWEGAVITLRDMQTVTRNGETSLVCQGGASNTSIARVALKYGLTGVEWMYRLPGFIGATTRINARCYGGEISKVVSKVVAVDKFGKEIVEVCKEIESRKKIFRGYKDTLFLLSKDIIAEVELTLQHGDRDEIHERMMNCERDRETKKQFAFPSCGCVFKNDYRAEVSVPSGLLLEKAGLKEVRLGGAQVSPFHANFIYNVNHASSSDILSLSFLMRERVWREFGVWLKYEMEVLGAIPGQHQELFELECPESFNVARLREVKEIFENQKKKSNLGSGL